MRLRIYSDIFGPMLKNSIALANAIEEKFSLRDMRGVRQLLPILISRCKNERVLRLRAADFLLRLPAPAAAFKLLSDHDDLNAESRLALANAANFLGASKYGLRVLESVPESVRLKKRVEVGQILSTNYLENEALVYFANGGTKAKPKAVPGEAGDRALLMRCYCLIELERYDEIFAISDFFLEPRHPLGRQAFALIFAAWASALSGDAKKSARFLKRFDNLPGTGETWPHTLYQLVAGISLAKSGQYKSALEHLRRSWEKSYIPGLQPEATWLYTLYWMGWARFAQSGKFPLEWMRLLAYPLATDYFQKKIAVITPLPQAFSLEVRGPKRSAAEVHLNLQENSAVIRGQPVMGLTTPMQLLGILASAGSIGVPMFRLFDVLWPDEPLSLRTHLKRLEAVVLRLRRQGFDVIWKDNHLWLAAKAKVSVEWSFGSGNDLAFSRDHFLKKHPTFKRKDVEIFFGVSARTAKRICQKWLNESLIAQIGSGPRTSYSSLLLSK